MRGSRSPAWPATPRTIRLGTLVSPVTFRSPGLLAISVAQVDQMSGGRVELGLGAGWYEAEHTAYAFDFPRRPARFDSLTDQLAIIDGLWTTPVGETLQLHRHRALGGRLARPAQADAAAGADRDGRRWHHPDAGAGRALRGRVQHAVRRRSTPSSQQRDRVRAACEAIGRTRPMVYSAALVVCVGRDEAEVARRAAAIGREPAELRENGAAGTLDEVAATIRRWHEAGAERMYLQILDLGDLDHLDLIAAEVAPQLA